jgi:pimeloyl-ACP methyl ester carboxylesterase
MATITSNGVPIVYETVGNGPPIVLVHGFASSRDGNWKSQGWFEYLVNEGRQVVALDCRGHGESGKPHDSAAYDGNQMSEDVVAVMDAAGIEKADLMGYSMGGGIALDLLVRHPGRFGLVIIGGAGLGGPGSDTSRRDGIAAALRAKDPTTIENPTARGFRRFAEQRGTNDLEALAAVMMSNRSFGNRDAVRKSKLPMLVVVGDKDDALAGAKALAEAVAGAELVLLNGEDHLSAVAAKGYKSAVSAFLKKHPPIG